MPDPFDLLDDDVIESTIEAMEGPCDAPWAEWGRALLMNGLEASWLRFNDRAWDIFEAQPDRLKDLEYAFTQAWMELQDKPHDPGYVATRKQPKALVVERINRPNWGLTKSGHMVEIKDGRTENEEKADPVVLVCGEGWQAWDAIRKGDVLIRKTSLAKKKQDPSQVRGLAGVP